ncbi:hypothetical protein PTRA_a1585 [Pseudoalteromonas translucida KMM 520]|uniref:Phage tail tape measure protein domain-containing protein n=1 Tax=Pseudoalteromonas translucida KMM 520 TaxID=1315283 RepID=A0A0U2VH29_9GAMM|nr:phage tail tape measure protein [Pseudoalteromonas translucida]ALS32773.1 hypothetical protein PTRA_a1585 [Pseudoalteromonas translucida KMM 520]
MSLPQSLMFTVGMIDQITKPIAKISSSLNGLTNDYQRGTMKMASGVAGIAGAGYALQNALMPAIEMDRALGEVSSLGVRESALKQLTDTSYEFALKYGKSSTEFVKSSYDIQSAIAGLNDADLSAFTLSSNVLATATKSDAGTITNYMGTMYGIFKNQANEMGKGEWVEQLTGMTATAVQAFKTTGTEMSSAFTAIGAEATSAGISMSEQMAVLGTLQATMSGSEAGTKYKSFLGGVGKAQDALGLSFTDSQGKMLPIIDILNKIKGKYGETIDVAEGDELKKAFGSAEAVGTIKLLMNDINGLSNSINELGNVFGMEKAEEMAQAMTDQTERLGQSWYVIRAAWGSAILPVFNDFVGLIADMGTGVVWFTEAFPNLTKWIGYAAVFILGFIAAGGLISVVMGGATMAMTAWNTATMIGRGISAAWTASIAILKGAMLALNIVMYANPILLIVAGIALAIAAVGALIYYWDDLKATMGEWGWIKAIVGVFTSVWSTVKNLFTSYLNWWIDKINMLPGVDVELISSGSNASTSTIDAIEPIRSKAEKGGITQQISNANQQKSTSVGTVNVYPAKGETNFMNFVEMQS